MLLLHHGLRLCPTHHLWLATEPEFCVHHSALRKCTTIHTINRAQLMLFRALSDRIRPMDTCRKSKAGRINKNYWTASKMWHTSTTETWKKKNKKTIHEICSKGNQIYLCLKSVWCVTWSFNYARGTLPRGGKEINLDCGIINCKAIVPSTKPISYPFAVCSKALYKLKWVFFLSNHSIYIYEFQGYSKILFYFEAVACVQVFMFKSEFFLIKSMPIVRGGN